MTFMRHFHRLAWCRDCDDLTPHDEDGKGICLTCLKVIEDWISTLPDDSPLRGAGIVGHQQPQVSTHD